MLSEVKDEAIVVVLVCICVHASGLCTQYKKKKQKQENIMDCWRSERSKHIKKLKKKESVSVLCWRRRRRQKQQKMGRKLLEKKGKQKAAAGFRFPFLPILQMDTRYDTQTKRSQVSHFHQKLVD